MEFDSQQYEEYLRTEWELFQKDPIRSQFTLEAVAGVSTRSVLDVGTGAGQELLPFAFKAFCVGVDIAPDVGKFGQRKFAQDRPKSNVVFARAAAESLPFRNNCFDVVICRLALPYTDNALALAEMSRVLIDGGVLLLKIHHARYYLKKLWDGLLSRNVLSAIHASRVLVAGVVYHIVRKQIRTAIPSPETFQTKWLLQRELSRVSLSIERELQGSNPLTPMFLIRAVNR